MIGFLNVYKPQGMSSAAVVGKIKKQFNLKKVGHMGTLDPLACGILPIAIGKATRMFDYFLNKEKQYVVEAKFGFETPSLDLGTEPINYVNHIPSFNDIKEACVLFKGKIEQIPPIYSAKNINGVKAYDLARQGKEAVLNASIVEIINFECVAQVDDNTFRFVIDCGSGTYVRSLIRDLAYKLNSLATVTYLERSQSGAFDKNNSINLQDVLLSNLNDCCLSIESVFNKFEVLIVSDFEFQKLRNGLTIKTSLSDTNNLFIKDENGNLLGVAVVLNGLIKIKTYLLED